MHVQCTCSYEICVNRYKHYCMYFRIHKPVVLEHPQHTSTDVDLVSSDVTVRCQVRILEGSLNIR